MGHTPSAEASGRTSVEIRKVRREDLPNLLGLVAALAAHHGDAACATVETLSRDVLGDGPWLRVLVAECEGRLAGYAALCPRAQMHFGIRGIDLHHLYVDPAFRGRGLGRRLIEACIEVATGLDCAFMVVSTEPGNHAAQAVYAACGFESHPSDGSRLRMRLPASARA